MGGFEKSSLLMVRKMVKKSSLRDSKNEIFFELECKKESIEEMKKRAITNSISNWNRTVEHQLKIQEKENALRKDFLDGNIVYTGRNNKNQNLGQIYAGPHVGSKLGSSIDSDLSEGEKDRQKDIYYTLSKTAPVCVEYPSLL